MFTRLDRLDSGPRRTLLRFRRIESSQRPCNAPAKTKFALAVYRHFFVVAPLPAVQFHASGQRHRVFPALLPLRYLQDLSQENGAGYLFKRNGSAFVS